jgi:hypothetical protein
MGYLGNTPEQQAFAPAVDFFSGNASTTEFTLSRPVVSVAQVQAVIENVPQNPGDAFTVAGNTITFTSAPPSGTNNIYVYYTSPITTVVQPGQGTVSLNSFSATGTPSASTFLRGDNSWATVTQTRVSGGTTGLTPSTLTGGDVTLAGTLVAANGGTGLTSPGTSGNVLTSNGTAWTSSASSFAGARGQIFTSSGTFTVPAGVSALKVTVVGGGGGGGSRTTLGAGGGGGGGGVAIEWLTGLTAGDSITVTVGAGGGSTASGGTSSFGAYCSATGGAGVAANNSTGGAAGSGSGGNINITGGAGSDTGDDGGGSAIQGAGGGSFTPSVMGKFGRYPMGGTGYFGGSGGSVTINIAANGVNATGYGNGGGGANRYSSGSFTGGSGTAGIVVVEW